MKTRTAAAAYAEHWDDVQRQIATLKIRLDVFNASPYANDTPIAPDWEHVGTMDHVSDLLGKAIQALDTD